jgi:hypothetical protein
MRTGNSDTQRSRACRPTDCSVHNSPLPILAEQATGSAAGRPDLHLRARLHQDVFIPSERVTANAHRLAL